ncbi:MAG: hypothetical protein ACE5IQ_11780 [Candidatus Methylomirabilales bacterium]
MTGTELTSVSVVVVILGFVLGLFAGVQAAFARVTRSSQLQVAPVAE